MQTMNKPTVKNAPKTPSKLHTYSQILLNIVLYSIGLSVVIQLLYNYGFAYPYSLHELPYVTAYVISLILSIIICSIITIYLNANYWNSQLYSVQLNNQILLRYQLQYAQLWDKAFQKLEKVLDNHIENLDNINSSQPKEEILNEDNQTNC